MCSLCVESDRGTGNGWKCEVGSGVPICVYTSSVRAPMNCGVAFRSVVRHSSSTYWPMAYQRADLRRCVALACHLQYTGTLQVYLLLLGGIIGSHGASVIGVSRGELVG
jgi:hypothetical protein